MVVTLQQRLGWSQKRNSKYNSIDVLCFSEIKIKLVTPKNCWQITFSFNSIPGPRNGSLTTDNLLLLHISMTSLNLNFQSAVYFQSDYLIIVRIKILYTYISLWNRAILSIRLFGDIVVTNTVFTFDCVSYGI